MSRNMGNMDRAVRFIIGVVMMGVGFGAMSGGAAIAVGVIGAILFATSVTGRCPLYIPFRISTRKV